MARARHSSGLGSFSKKNKSIANDWSSPSRAEEKATDNSRSSVLTQVMDDDENYGGLKRMTIGGLKKYHGNYVKENQKINSLMISEMMKGRGKPKNLKVRYEVESEHDSMMDDQSMLNTSEEDSDDVASDKFVKRLMKKAEQGRNSKKNSEKRSKESSKRQSREIQVRAPSFANDYAIIPHELIPPVPGANSFPSRNVPSSV